jgi:cellulose synthase/poly-beta-1,6-N-acetylglucosamine synthase-like glycosyltransferase
VPKWWVCRTSGACRIKYIRREKVPGVSHHAKAGNVNSCLLKESTSRGQFLLVLDCDMMVNANFLMRAIPHFYQHRHLTAGALMSGFCKDADMGSSPYVLTRASSGSRLGSQDWVLSDTAGYLQTPQDFWNVIPSDPLVRVTG